MTLHPALRFGLKSLAFLAKAVLVLAGASIALAFVVLSVVSRSSRSLQKGSTGGVYDGTTELEYACPPLIYAPTSSTE